jgi:LacI family transcriptional regulator
MPHTNQQAIAVLVESSTSWGRDIIRGIRRYAQEGNDWVFYLQPWGIYDRLRLPSRWHGDGIIARINHDALMRDVIKSGVPAINVSTIPVQKPGQVVNCTVNEFSIAKLAVEHFLERGFRHFAHCSYSVARPHYEDQLWKGFAETVSAAGYTAVNYRPDVERTQSPNWETQMRKLGRWLKQQPKPLAVLAFNCVEARNIAATCRRQGINVPEEVALLAGDHDDLICETAAPPISSVDPRAKQVGYHAARLLDAMMRGEKVDSQYLLEPAGIIVRQSTDSMAVDDPELSMALSFIRKNATKPINISSILKEVPIGRRSLEQSCMSLLGRSPAAEIRRLRLKNATQLLEETDLSVDQIARASGFESPDVLLRNFRRAYDLTPSAYRNEHQHKKRGPG